MMPGTGEMWVSVARSNLRSTAEACNALTQTSYPCSSGRVTKCFVVKSRELNSSIIQNSDRKVDEREIRRKCVDFYDNF